MDERPIIIGGPDRCGKTLLRALLVSHPNIAIPAVGSNYWTFFYRQFGDLSRRENFERCLAAMLRYKHALFLHPDAERIRREFHEGEPSYGRLFALFHRHYAEREGKPRWGDQTGLIERYADEVLAAYPGAKIIHMIRDPRDRYEASLALWPNGRMRAGGATARWRYSAQLARRNLRRHPDRYRVLRYETLVQDPEHTLRELCDYIGEEYTPHMLTMEGAIRYRDKGEHRAAGEQGVISTSYIGRYRRSVPKDEIAFIQSLARREMRELDYELERITFTSAERLAYVVAGWPANMARMLIWGGLEAVQHRFPAFVGRRPVARKVVREQGAPT
jgi:hypothetical protein